MRWRGDGEFPEADGHSGPPATLRAGAAGACHAPQVRTVEQALWREAPLVCLGPFSPGPRPARAATSALGPRRTPCAKVIGGGRAFRNGHRRAATGSAVDWAAGPLGPVEEWSDSLRTAVRAVMPAQVPILLMWGPELTQIYNDANRLFMGNKHPAAMGLPAAQTWQEMWPEVGPLVWSVARGGEPISRVIRCSSLTATAYPDESSWTFSYSPWPDSLGEEAESRALGLETALREIAASGWPWASLGATTGLRIRSPSRCFAGSAMTPIRGSLKWPKR